MEHLLIYVLFPSIGIIIIKNKIIIQIPEYAMIQDKFGKTNKKRYGKIKKNLIAVYSTKNYILYYYI